MRTIIYGLMVALTFIGFFLSGYLYGVVRNEQKAHHAYVRQMEIEMADLKSRLAVLEKMRIQVDVVDHSGWMVSSVETD